MTLNLEPLQCSIINSSPFTVDNIVNLEYPMAPMTSVNYVTDSNMLIIKTVVFVDSAAGINPDELSFVSSESKGVLTLTLDYTFKEETPTTFSCFYIELSYPSTPGQITSVITFLNNEDPKTSRGTTTEVPPL